MNIVELSEKNISEAKNLHKLAKNDFYQALGNEEYVNFNVKENLLIGDENMMTYLLTDKGYYQALVTINKNKAEIENFWVNYSSIEHTSLDKLMEFAIKQFSAITLVFIWIDSTDDKSTEVLENYGFEYTGEQDYVDKEKNLLKYKYVYKRKK